MGVQFIDYANPESTGPRVLAGWDGVDPKDPAQVEAFVNQVATELQMLAMNAKRSDRRLVARDERLVTTEARIDYLEGHCASHMTRWQHLRAAFFPSIR